MIVAMWSLVGQQLAAARVLAGQDGSRPTQASLRRAVSTAYYALFQALCETCADTLVGWDKPWEVITPIFRSLEHNRTAQVLTTRAFTTTPRLERLGSVFIELQAAREWADYSPEPRQNFHSARRIQPFTLAEANALIGFAEEAIRILDALGQDDRLRLATRLVTKTRK